MKKKLLFSAGILILLVLVVVTVFFILPRRKPDFPGAAAGGKYYYTCKNRIYCYDPVKDKNSRVLRGTKCGSELLLDEDGCLLFISNNALYHLDPANNSKTKLVELGSLMTTTQMPLLGIRRAVDGKTLMILSGEGYKKVDSETWVVSDLEKDNDSPTASLLPYSQLYVNCSRDPVQIGRVY